jgi:hypothetical protein
MYFWPDYFLLFIVKGGRKYSNTVKGGQNKNTVKGGQKCSDTVRVKFRSFGTLSPTVKQSNSTGPPYSNNCDTKTVVNTFVIQCIKTKFGHIQNISE